VIIGSDTKLEVPVTGPGTLGLRFSLVDPARGTELLAGEASRTSPDTYSIQLPSAETSKLRAGQYQLVLTAFSDELSSVTERIQTITAGAQTTQTTTQPTVITTTTTTTTTTTGTTTRTTPPTPGTPTTGADVLIYAAAAVGAVIVIGAIVAMRMRAKRSKT
jgi:peptide/nickel transport system substrate-binding protein